MCREIATVFSLEIGSYNDNQARARAWEVIAMWTLEGTNGHCAIGVRSYHVTEAKSCPPCRLRCEKANGYAVLLVLSMPLEDH